MPPVNKDILQRTDRFDGQEGNIKVVPTAMSFFESDGTDIRVNRVYVYRPDGSLEHILLIDSMGVPFVDLPDVLDDLDYLEKVLGT